MIKSLQNMKNGVIPPGSSSCLDNDGFIFSLPGLLFDLNITSASASKLAGLLTSDANTLADISAQNGIIASTIRKITNNGDENKYIYLSDDEDKEYKEIDIDELTSLLKTQVDKMNAR